MQALTERHASSTRVLVRVSHAFENERLQVYTHVERGLPLKKGPPPRIALYLLDRSSGDH